MNDNSQSVLKELAVPGSVVSYKAADGTTKYRLIVLPGMGYDLVAVTDKDGEVHVGLEEGREEITKDNVGDDFHFMEGPLSPVGAMQDMVKGEFESCLGEIITDKR